jgi:hypothetical protein
VYFAIGSCGNLGRADLDLTAAELWEPVDVLEGGARLAQLGDALYCASPSTLYRVSTDDGALTTVVELPTSGPILGAGDRLLLATSSGSSAGLFEIDPEAGEAVEVSSDIRQSVALAYDPEADLLYVRSLDTLWEVALNTGQTRSLHEFSTSANVMALGPSDVFVATDDGILRIPRN